MTTDVEATTTSEWSFMLRQAIEIPKNIIKHFYVPHLPEHKTTFTTYFKRSKHTEHEELCAQ
jgi:hypothetical protein